ncbi:uncharacterized protein LOC116338443 isoform X2 [Contarinia nasturtii]|nr:uncharacterized protein LOC116338443 isoform X2 [Contarinia nasturtii]XP_031619560.1 uncharacterized protein LOC116338443 isoform X2 [Contarinia nasturtii]XP_031619561.1 uncharacterized protein LOC116338443 isoform X2 [Contarinia nasturtii]
MWVSSSNFYATDVIDNSNKAIESQSSDATGNESTYKNLSKVRTYLKRCENAINSINLGGKRSTPSSAETDINNEGTKQPTSSWYIDEFGTETKEDLNFSDLNFLENDLSSTKAMEKSMPEDEITNSINEYENNHIKKNEHIMPEFHMANEKDINELVDMHLAALYPKYLETRAILLRQARDLLQTTFHGDLVSFEREFLSPSAEIIKTIKNASHDLSNTVCVDGWPLAIAGKVILHLGTLSESFVTSTDIYLCLKPTEVYFNEKSHVDLCAVWRSFKTQKIVYQTLNPNNSLTSISLEMLTSDDLPQLLQSLLVSVEQTISRIPFDELAFPKYTDDDEIDNHKWKDTAGRSNLGNSSDGSPKCGIKRREIITKSKPLQSRYTLRRISIKSSTDNRENRDIDVSTSSAATRNINTPNNMMPLFCLGGSFPHIDSDEDSADDGTKSPNNQACHQHDIVAPGPRSITDLPEKLLTSGVYLSDTHDLNGFPIITIETKILMESGLNCYEVATLILYYNTIPTNPSKFTLHAIVSDSNQLPIFNLLDNAFNLLTGHIHIDSVLVSTLFTNDKLQFHLPLSKIKILHVIELFDHIAPVFAPKICNGAYIHNQSLWREFFVTLELLRNQCVSVGQDLVAVMNEIRLTDSLGMPSRRQLYSQHRALSRALMDSDLQCLRRKGQITLTRLQSLAKSISSNDKSNTNHNMTIDSSAFTAEYSNRHVYHRLKEVMSIFGEVDRASRRLEQLTEQRRERLREITRQKALEEEMKEITKWIQNDGESMLKKYADIALDSETSIKDCEHEFEKFYFISMKHLAKGRDLEEATLNMESAKELRTCLKQNLSQYSDRLEVIRERIEGAVRLHHLLSLEFKEKDVQLEMQKLAEKIGALNLIERCRNMTKCMTNAKTDKINSTPSKESNCTYWPSEARFHSNHDMKTAEMIGDEDEDHSKIADSGLGGCDRCEMNDKLIRTCSCQSFDEPTSKSHNSDEMEEDFDNNIKGGIDYQMSPLTPNAHLYSYSSNITLPDLENTNGLAPKTQK